MNKHLITILTIGLFACGGSQSADTTPAPTTTGGAEMEDQTAQADDRAAPTDDPGSEQSDAGEFQINDAEKSSRPAQAKLQATKTEAAVRFFVVDKDKGPIEGIVISLTSPTGDKYYTKETDAEGFAEVLVPIGQTYELVYLSLGRRDVAAKVDVADEPNLNLKLTLRYKKEEYPTGKPDPEPQLVLEDVHFETGKATLTKDSFERLDAVVEYMTHKKSARIEVSGHTDNVGNPRGNKRLSRKRAEAVRTYLVSKGIAGNRIKAVGYGAERPIAPNDTDEGRQKNRRIEVTEL